MATIDFNKMIFPNDTNTYQVKLLPLQFTGAINETYDGTQQKTINIPTGGGGSIDTSNFITKKGNFTIDSTVVPHEMNTQIELKNTGLYVNTMSYTGPGTTKKTDRYLGIIGNYEGGDLFLQYKNTNGTTNYQFAGQGDDGSDETIATRNWVQNKTEGIYVGPHSGTDWNYTYLHKDGIDIIDPMDYSITKLTHDSLMITDADNLDYTAYGNGSIKIKKPGGSGEQTINLPIISGTLALTSEIPDTSNFVKNNQALNISYPRATDSAKMSITSNDDTVDIEAEFSEGMVLHGFKFNPRNLTLQCEHPLGASALYTFKTPFDGGQYTGGTVATEEWVATQIQTPTNLVTTNTNQDISSFKTFKPDKPDTYPGISIQGSKNTDASMEMYNWGLNFYKQNGVYQGSITLNAEGISLNSQMASLVYPTLSEDEKTTTSRKSTLATQYWSNSQYLKKSDTAQTTYLSVAAYTSLYIKDGESYIGYANKLKVSGVEYNQCQFMINRKYEQITVTVIRNGQTPILLNKNAGSSTASFVIYMEYATGFKFAKPTAQ